MAVSNSIGSNVFDILIGLGLPWALQTLAVNYGSYVSPAFIHFSFFNKTDLLREKKNKSKILSIKFKAITPVTVEQ